MLHYNYFAEIITIYRTSCVHLNLASFLKRTFTVHKSRLVVWYTTLTYCDKSCKPAVVSSQQPPLWEKRRNGKPLPTPFIDNVALIFRSILMPNILQCYYVRDRFFNRYETFFKSLLVSIFSFYLYPSADFQSDKTRLCWQNNTANSCTRETMIVIKSFGNRSGVEPVMSRTAQRLVTTLWQRPYWKLCSKKLNNR